MKEKYSQLFSNVKEIQPLVHHMTNYVTVNDCANITIAIGASPIMADEIAEMEEFVNISQALVLNIGTINERVLKSMLVAGKIANKKNVPVILDPVGVGASQFRNQALERLLDCVQFSCIKGNVSEIRFLAGLSSKTRGVDADIRDEMTSEDLANMAKKLAEKLESVIVITGVVDTVADCENVYLIKNGHEKLSSISGTGCMSASLLGAFIGANPSERVLSSVLAITSMGIAGEIASEKTRGNGSFKVALHDEISCLDIQTFNDRERIISL
ncbi:hydroxyethylthiazole kinase [Pilibacter termitis]|uniref:Hydroxyethylthiazole kinase n=1 Tax=Pilibacter termitis TaxID=263852 RepID=A0A1T4L3S6_9ENTE|nr:hydroxyethylthiazole kinase [Pilibacter termitis]SJZ49303.1 hydroxyethylthiazole kinase [Pilibacter termitis]